MKTEFSVEIDGITRTEWCAVLDQFDDASIYQSWSYGSVRWGEKSLSHLVLREQDQIVAAAQLRILSPASLQFGIAYLRWGPLLLRRGAIEELRVARAMAEQLRLEYVRKRKLYLEVLPNAFQNTSRAEVFRDAFQSYQPTKSVANSSYRTFVLDLLEPLETIRRGLDKKWRNQLGAAERAQLTIVRDKSDEQYQMFCNLYDQMWARKKFATTVSTEEFGRIQNDLQEKDRMQVFIASINGSAAAGLVLSAMGNTGIYLLGATNEEGMKCKAAYALQWAAIQWLKLNGFRHYDLGGTDPAANPGVHHFKSGISGRDLSHMMPLTACESALSAAAVRTGNVLRGGLRSLRQRVTHA